MKTAFFAILLMTLPAWSHGSKAKQALDAITEATKLLHADFDRATVNKLARVQITHTGHEMFDVTFELRDASPITYACHENEDHADEGIITWECVRR